MVSYLPCTQGEKACGSKWQKNCRAYRILKIMHGCRAGRHNTYFVIILYELFLFCIIYEVLHIIKRTYVFYSIELGTYFEFMAIFILNNKAKPKV